jgi:hypothetical protein
MSTVMQQRREAKQLPGALKILVCDEKLGFQYLPGVLAKLMKNPISLMDAANRVLEPGCERHRGKPCAPLPAA